MNLHGNATNNQQTAAGPRAGEIQRRAKFELGVSLILSSWPALTLAVQNEWGGPSSADKRDWFAGAICELFPTETSPNPQNMEDMLQDVEERLLQIMDDEFEVVPDDDSGFAIAEKIVRVWEDTSKGEFVAVNRMYELWTTGRLNKVAAIQEGGGNESQESSDDDDEVDENEDEDEEMSDAPPELVPARQTVAPETDEDGFQKVVGKRRR